MRDLVEYVVAEARRLGAEFADVRIVESRHLTITLRDGVPEIYSGVDFGASVRVYVSGSIGFAYTTDVSKQSLLRALERALAMARAGRGAASAPKPVELKSLEDSYEWPQQLRVEDVAVEEKLRDLQEADRIVASKDYVKSRTLVYSEATERRVYGSTEDRFVEEARSLVRVFATAVAKQAGVVASASRNIGTIKGYVVWRKESQEEFASKLLARLESQLRAKTPRAGVFPIVLDSEAVGVFVHEAFGHLAEADSIASGSALQGKLGQRVASELVTIVDDPTLDDGFGTFKYDDEGVRASRVVIVEKGVHRQFMTDRLYATHFGVDPTGNGRAESFRVRPIVRMRNTVLLPGDYSFDELLEGIRFGYYIVATRGGQTNIDGSFQVGVQEAYEIVNGRIGDPVRNLSISGNTLETLLNVDAVGKEFKLSYGLCGKAGQSVPVSLGGAPVRVKAVTVGGRA
jgi:TldD protein